MSSRKTPRSNVNVNVNVNQKTSSGNSKNSQINNRMLFEKIDGNKIIPENTPFGVVSAKDQKAVLDEPRDPSFHERIMKTIRMKK